MSQREIQVKRNRYCSLHRTEMIKCKYHQGFWFCPDCEHVEIKEEIECKVNRSSKSKNI